MCHVYLACEKGATMIEYVVISAGVALAVMAAVFVFGDEVSLLYDGLENVLINPQSTNA